MCIKRCPQARRQAGPPEPWRMHLSPQELEVLCTVHGRWCATHHNLAGSADPGWGQREVGTFGEGLHAGMGKVLSTLQALGTQAQAYTLCGHAASPFPARLPWPAHHAARGQCPPAACPPNAQGCCPPRPAQGVPGALLSCILSARLTTPLPASCPQVPPCCPYRFM